MNNRIKELMNQAGLTISHSGIVLTKNVSGGEALEKFSELIVQECVGIELYWLNEQDRKAVSEKIKEHFGIER